MIHQTFEYANSTQFQMRVRKQYASPKYYKSHVEIAEDFAWPKKNLCASVPSVVEKSRWTFELGEAKSWKFEEVFPFACAQTVLSFCDL